MAMCGFDRRVGLVKVWRSEAVKALGLIRVRVKGFGFRVRDHAFQRVPAWTFKAFGPRVYVRASCGAQKPRRKTVASLQSWSLVVSLWPQNHVYKPQGYELGFLEIEDLWFRL